MRVYTHTEPGRRILAWSGVIAALVLYGGSFVEEYQQTGAVTAWWPVAIFWTIVVTAAGRVLMTPRHWADIDEHSRRVTVYRDGALSGEILLDQLAPLEVAEQVSNKGSKSFRVWHIVRSQRHPEIGFYQSANPRKASKRLVILGKRLRLPVAREVVSSPDLNERGELREAAAEAEAEAALDKDAAG